MQKLLTLVTLACGLALLGGCESTSTGVGKKLSQPEQVAITKGMDAEELLAALGEPISVEQVDAERPGIEIWTYAKENSQVQLVTTGMRETPYIDPISGVETTIKDPILSPMRTSVEEKTKFLVADGKVVSWKVERDESSYITE